MQTFFVLVAAFLAVAVHGLEPDTKIVGGFDAPKGKFPYQVSLQVDNNHFCGGSIVNKRTILTAAHCLMGKNHPSIIRRMSAHVGSNLLNTPGAIYSVERIISHSAFNRFLLVNDIGLVILSSEIQYTELIQQIPLATDTAFPGDKCVLSGWGYTSFGGAVPNKLQAIELVVYDQERCRAAFGLIQDSHICTFTRRNEGACNGDSGSPVVSNGAQIGIVSFGRPCAVGAPDVHTRVSYFRDWLQRNIPETS